MAVILKNAIFLHIPKCGGEWVRQVLWDAGLEEIKLDPGLQKHADLNYFKARPELARPFRFSFVRHPVTWYQSFYHYQRNRRWTVIPEVELRPPKEMSYKAFVRCVVDYHPGFLGRLYERYVGSEESPIEFIGRTRSLRTDLAEALLRSGHQVPRRLIDTLPRININPVPQIRSVAIDDAIMEAEKDLCLRFGFL